LKAGILIAGFLILRLMLKTSIIIALLISTLLCTAQQSDTTCYTDKFLKINIGDEDNIFSLGTCTIEPYFKGGTREWIKFLSTNVSFDKIIKSIPDSTTDYLDSVIMKFIVNKQGKISDLEILYAGNDAIEKESIRLIKLSCPYWVPGVASSGIYLNAWHIEKIAFIIKKEHDSLFTKITVKK